MRVLTLAASGLLAGLAAAGAQESPPLQPYVPPPSASPLAPLPNAQPPQSAPQNLGDVRLNSDTAANISPHDTHSLIAPALPAPVVSGTSVAAYLGAAQSALAAGQTGATQSALEEAETLALTRSVPMSAARDPSHAPLVLAISAAREALSSGNRQDTAAHITAALSLAKSN